MPSVYDPDAFAQRVNYAAQCIVAGGNRTRTRHFDTCFEMCDGDLVVAALIRRAAKNPNLTQAIEQVMGVDGVEHWRQTAARWVRVSARQLARAAQAERERAADDFAQRIRPRNQNDTI